MLKKTKTGEHAWKVETAQLRVCCKLREDMRLNLTGSH